MKNSIFHREKPEKGHEGTFCRSCICDIELMDGQSFAVDAATAVINYAPYIAAVHLGAECTQTFTQFVLFAASLFGNPNYKAIKFYWFDGTDITREMQQAFEDRMNVL